MKAFNKCDHGVNAHKICTKGITGKVGRWRFNFLMNRTQCVIINKVKSRSSTKKLSLPGYCLCSGTLTYIACVEDYIYFVLITSRLGQL